MKAGAGSLCGTGAGCGVFISAFTMPLAPVIAASDIGVGVLIEGIPAVTPIDAADVLNALRNDEAGRGGCTVGLTLLILMVRQDSQ